MILTILTSTSKELRKTITIDQAGGWESNKIVFPKKFTASGQEVRNLDELGKLMNKLTRYPKKCIVMGKMKKGAWEENKVNRRTKENLPEQKSNVILLDIDGVDIGMEVTTKTSIAEVGAKVRNLLPPPFDTAECVVQATSGYGRPGKGHDAVRVRLAFFNKYALELRRLGALLVAEHVAGFDKSTLQSYQPIFTASPKFVYDDPDDVGGDPIVQRLVRISGDDLEVKNEDLPTLKASVHIIRMRDEEDTLIEAINRAGLGTDTQPVYSEEYGGYNTKVKCFQAHKHTDPGDDGGGWIGQKDGRVWVGCQHNSCGSGEKNLINELRSFLLNEGHLQEDDIPDINDLNFYDECVFITSSGKFYHKPTGVLVTKQTFDIMTGGKAAVFRTGDMEEGIMPGHVVDDLVFIPNGELFITDHGREYCNTYRCPSTWLEPEGDPDEIWNIFEEHIKFLWDEHADLILDWYAHIVQYPEKRNVFVPLHVSKEHGVGRTLVTDIIERVIGVMYARRTTIKRMVEGDFNDAFNDSLLLTINETSSKKEKYSISEELRDQFTDNRMEVNVKYGEKTTKHIYTSVQLNANDLNAVGLPEEDRRMFIHLITKKEKDWAYYARLASLLNNGAAAVLREKLSQRDLTEFRHITRAPDTSAKTEMIENTGSDLDKILKDIRAKWPSDLLTPQQLLSLVNIIEEREDLPQTDFYSRGWQPACRDLFTKGGRNKNNKLLWKNKKVLPWVLRDSCKWKQADNKDWMTEIAKSEDVLKTFAKDSHMSLDDLF